MPRNDDRLSRPPEQPTLFEKPPGAEQKPPRTRVPAGVFVGVFIAVLVVLAIVLFTAASCGGGAGGNGQTTGGLVLLLPTLGG
ncbi:hypothetical protein [Actinomycetospora sp. TBRC 11914]|uniref:hypothetical protein n=1 Tax=Actinomycetospora sp. TBRC 11914 TaxID=2729387 RepID=UPI00145EEBBD|nr:hypothetical protein [Actinomycetospora sp. TBRC 11914]NMO88908.1 hypothetical protein [Actinomycetospora sp. TBRC 11914]